MPELAETFVLAQQLAQLVGAEFVTDSRLRLPWALAVPLLGQGPFELIIHDAISICGDQSIEDDFKGGATPIRVQHQGKKIWVLWKNASGVVETEIRLGMTGGFSIERTPHTRLEFKSKAGSFFFNDIRKFGGIVVGGNSVSPSATAIYDQDQIYRTVMQNRDSTLKEVITDQRLLFSGVGNYVANEACFRSNLHPDSHAGLVTKDEFALVVRQIKLVVRESVTLGGCTLRDFKDVLRRPGKFQDELMIYGKKFCPACCGNVVVVRRPTDTTSWVCPKCQEVRRYHPLARC